MTSFQNPTPIAVHLQPVIFSPKSFGLVIIDRADGQGWAFPSGYIEYPEDASVELAAQREFQEETGILPPKGELFHSQTAGDKILLFCRAKTPIPVEIFHNWMPTKEAVGIDFIYNVGDQKLCFPTHLQALKIWRRRTTLNWLSFEPGEYELERITL